MKRISAAIGAALVLVIGLTGCPKKDETDETDVTAKADKDKDKTEPTTAGTTAEPTTPPPPAGASIVARAKAELDGKEGGTGSTMVVTGTKGAFLVHDWAQSKSGEYGLALSKDDKSRFASASFKEGEASKPKIDGASTALGLTECQWGSPASVSLGKDKLPATVADGVCKRGEATARTVWATVPGEDLNFVGVGSWDDPGGSDTAVFDVFRSTRKVAVNKGPDPIAACCNALQQNMASAPIEQKGGYMLAISACNGLRGSPEGRAALGQVRAALVGVGAPAACR